MLYVQQSLGPNEELVHIGRFHWMYTVRAFMAIFWGLVGSIMVIIGSVYLYKMTGRFPSDLNWIEAIRYVHPGLRIAAFFVFVLGLLSFAQMMVTKATTEIAITNSRIIFKRGLIARYVGEINIDRIEGVNILQTIFGRLFNYGRLAIRGMGIGEVILPPIADPITFRQAIEKARSL
ncbi:MAG: PH domain-containing protein [Alphaproteobacteria bacterium]|nr:PH domain-containing protein [Alphaproteobacteria bacterium]